MFVLVQHASLPRGHASIRIQQYVGIITCMGLVLLRANEMDRELRVYMYRPTLFKTSVV